MKKLTLAIAFLALTFAASAQNNRFYISLQGGPQLSKSETMGNTAHGYNSNLTWQTGLLGGYQFKNSRLQLETGLQLARHDMEMFYAISPYGRYFNMPVTPKIIDAYTAWQIPLRLKVDLMNPGNKLKIRSVTGLKTIFLNTHSLTPETEFSKLEFNENYRYTISNQNHTEEFALGNPYIEYAVLGLEAGFEFSYQLNNRLSLQSSLIYQLGLDNVKSRQHVHQKWEGDNSRNEVNPYQVYHSNSRAEALALSFGLSYHFSNRAE